MFCLPSFSVYCTISRCARCLLLYWLFLFGTEATGIEHLTSGPGMNDLIPLIPLLSHAHASLPSSSFVASLHPFMSGQNLIFPALSVKVMRGKRAVATIAPSSSAGESIFRVVGGLCSK